MIRLAAGIDYVDLNFLGYPGHHRHRRAAAARAVALIDPGPLDEPGQPRNGLESRRHADERRPADPADPHPSRSRRRGRARFVEENPADRGLRPRARRAAPGGSRRSCCRARRGSTDRTWSGSGGSSCRCRSDRLRVLKGGERIRSRGRTLEVAYTPGHASHHVSYFEPSSRIAFVGDTAGIRRGSGLYVMPASPPPDVDLELWRDERGADPRVGSGHAVPDPLRSVQWRAAAFSGTDGPAGRVEPVSRGAGERHDARRRASGSSGSSRRRSQELRGSWGSRKRNSTAAPGVLPTRGRAWRGTGGRSAKLRSRRQAWYMRLKRIRHGSFIMIHTNSLSLRWRSVIASPLARRSGAESRCSRRRPPTVTAENGSWYLSGGPIAFGGSVYYPAGAALRTSSGNEMVRTGILGGVADLRADHPGAGKRHLRPAGWRRDAALRAAPHRRSGRAPWAVPRRRSWSSRHQPTGK